MGVRTCVVCACLRQSLNFAVWSCFWDDQTLIYIITIAPFCGTNTDLQVVWLNNARLIGDILMTTDAVLWQIGRVE